MTAAPGVVQRQELWAELLPIQVRRRWSWGTLEALTTSMVSFDVPLSEILPPDWASKFWVLAEIRGYRGASTSTASSAVINDIRVKGGSTILPSGATGDGWGLDAQAGPLPVFVPLPKEWSGALTVDATSDNNAGQSFRFMFLLIQVTEAEWLAYRGECQ
jgi:hypothetical protein